MANRVLRNYCKDGTEILRVSFRDDTRSLLRVNSMGQELIRKTVYDSLTKGVSLGGRKYHFLGCSNSQLKDHGAYFLHETAEITVERVRRELGNFLDMPSVPKVLARMGQCFTQARRSETELKLEETGVIHDIIGGSNAADKPYVFSDGVGTICLELATMIAKENSMDVTPSAIQIRHRGEKGLVSVDPCMDEVNELRKLRSSNDGEPLSAKKFLSRPSMTKFEVEAVDKNGLTKIEVVKFAKPERTTLNKPFINILDQVSELNSRRCHKRVTNRIKQLLAEHMEYATKVLIDEKQALACLQDIPMAVQMQLLESRLELTTEPFFRSMLIAYVKWDLLKSLRKMRIRIPHSLGRSFFGVIDTTGHLQHGQVFVQYSQQMGKESAKVEGEKVIRKGRVLLTKNPCIVAGDVRMFEAVDIEELHHLVDVVVFPQHGPRPHPDEMAGSDLDGDEYVVLWDEELFLESNCPAMDFPIGDPSGEWDVDPNTINERLAEFYTKVVLSDTVGLYSNAHLALSDLIGITAKSCNRIAAKIAQSLDFQKSGEEPAPLTLEDTVENGEFVVKERASRRPSFMQGRFDASYESRGVMSHIDREVERHINALSDAEMRSPQIPIDKRIDFPNSLECTDGVTAELDGYTFEITFLLDTYGVCSEAELMSGFYDNIRNRISEKEMDIVNMFNTNEVIKEKLRAIQKKYRERFFTHLCNWNGDLATVDYGKIDFALEVTKAQTDVMKANAVAAYKITYERANAALATEDTIILSYPWIFYDILAEIKFGEERRTRLENRPIYTKMWKMVRSFTSHPSQAEHYAKFRSEFIDGEEKLSSILRNHKNLPKVAFTLLRWSDGMALSQHSKALTRRHFIGLLVSYALGLQEKINYSFIHNTKSRRTMTRPGKLLVDFLMWIASRKFQCQSTLRLRGVDDNVVFLRGEWEFLHEIAVAGNLYAVINFSLPLPSDSTPIDRTLSIIKELNPFVIELPDEACKQRRKALEEQIKAATGCADVGLEQPRFGRLMVSAIGTIPSLRRIKKLVTLRAPPRENFKERGAEEKFAKLIFDQIVNAPPFDSTCMAPRRDQLVLSNHTWSFGVGGRSHGWNGINDIDISALVAAAMQNIFPRIPTSH